MSNQSTILISKNSDQKELMRQVNQNWWARKQNEIKQKGEEEEEDEDETENEDEDEEPLMACVVEENWEHLDWDTHSLTASTGGQGWEFLNMVSSTGVK